MSLMSSIRRTYKKGCGNLMCNIIGFGFDFSLYIFSSDLFLLIGFHFFMVDGCGSDTCSHVFFLLVLVLNLGCSCFDVFDFSS